MHDPKPQSVDSLEHPRPGRLVSMLPLAATCTSARSGACVNPRQTPLWRLGVSSVLLLATTAVMAQESAPTLKLGLPGGGELEVDRVELLSLPDVAREAPRELEEMDPRAEIERFAYEPDEAVEERLLDISEVRQIALENNLDLRAQLVQPAIARTFVDEERARFESIFSASLFVNSREPLPAPGDPPISTDGFEASLALDVPLRTGGTVSVSIPTTFTDVDIDGIDDIQESSLSLSISQPLLRNAGRLVNESPIEIAKFRSIQQGARTKLSAIQTLAGAENAYWDLYDASRTLDIRLEQYERALELERKAIRLAEVQVVPRIEVVRARAGVARKFQDIIFARTRRQLAERALKLVLDAPPLEVSGETRLLTGTDPQPLFFDFDRDEVVRLALDNRLDLIDTQLQLSVEERSVLFSRNLTRPQLDLEANTSLSDRGEDFSESFGGDFVSWQIGARFQVPIGNEAANSQFRRSRLQRQVAETNIEIQRRVITQQVLDALDVVEQSWQRILAARQEVVFASEAYDAEERQFLAGTRTSTDVFEAADFLAEAQVREIQALSSYEQSLISGALATGTLLGKGDVRLQLEG